MKQDSGSISSIFIAIKDSNKFTDNSLSYEEGINENLLSDLDWPSDTPVNVWDKNYSIDTNDSFYGPCFYEGTEEIVIGSFKQTIQEGVSGTIKLEFGVSDIFYDEDYIARDLVTIPASILVTGGSVGDITTIDITQDSMKLNIGESQKIQYNLTPTDSTDTVSFSSSIPAVASVDNSGYVTANHPGTTEITATTSSGGSDTIVVKRRSVSASRSPRS